MTTKKYIDKNLISLITTNFNIDKTSDKFMSCDEIHKKIINMKGGFYTNSPIPAYQRYTTTKIGSYLNKVFGLKSVRQGMLRIRGYSGISFIETPSI
jgi:hypothetical protein